MRFVRKSIEERSGTARASFVKHPLCWCVFIANLHGTALPAADDTAAVRPPPPKADSGELVHHYSASLVFIEERGGAGSAFVCRTKDGLFLFTNQHVVAGMTAPRFTRLDGSLIKTGAISGAIGHDLIRFALSEADRPMPASDNVEAEARIGDEIIVLGNLEGARVIQPLTGKLAGIGPDRIEVTAEFLPGNSGSPILHLKSGKVIGVATYIMRGEFGALTDAREARLRRFGYRLDSAKEWQPIAWSAYQAEKVEVEKIDRLTRDLIRLIDDIADDTRIDTSAHSNPVLARPVRELSNSLSNRTLSTIDRTRAVKNFLATLRAITQSDVTQARGKLRYDFFRRDLIEQTRMRERIFQLFDRSLKSDR